MPTAASDHAPIRGACGHDCPDTCAWTVGVQDGMATALEGDPAHPFTRGTLCAKVNHYLERVYHPDRVLQPLKRTGRKGAEVSSDRHQPMIAQIGPVERGGAILGHRLAGRVEQRGPDLFFGPVAGVGHQPAATAKRLSKRPSSALVSSRPVRRSTTTSQDAEYAATRSDPRSSPWAPSWPQPSMAKLVSCQNRGVALSQRAGAAKSGKRARPISLPVSRKRLSICWSIRPLEPPPPTAHRASFCPAGLPPIAGCAQR